MTARTMCCPDSDSDSSYSASGSGVDGEHSSDSSVILDTTSSDDSDNDGALAHRDVSSGSDEDASGGDGSDADGRKPAKRRKFSLALLRETDSVEEAAELLRSYRASGTGAFADDYISVLGKSTAGQRGSYELPSDAAPPASLDDDCSGGSGVACVVGRPDYRSSGTGSSELVHECLIMQHGRHALLYDGTSHCGFCFCGFCFASFAACVGVIVFFLRLCVCACPSGCAESGKLTQMQLFMLRCAYENVTSTAMITSTVDVVKYVSVCFACVHRLWPLFD
jgi:hypothetical protein